MMEAPMVESRVRGGGMVLVVVFSAACYPLIKAGLVYAPALRFAGLRTLLAGLGLLGVLALTGRRLWPRGILGWWIVPLGLTATTLTFGTMFLSPVYLGTGLATVLGNLQPLLIVLLAAPLLGERVTSRKAVVLALAMAGLVLIGLSQEQRGEIHAIHGALLALGTSAGAAVASVLVKKLRPGTDLPVLTAWQLVAGSLPLLAWSMAVEPAAIHWTPVFWALLLSLALAGTALTSLVWFWLLQQAEAGRLALGLFLVPLLGLGFAVLFYGERFPDLTGWGVLLILLALGATVGLRCREGT